MNVYSSAKYVENNLKNRLVVVKKHTKLRRHTAAEYVTTGLILWATFKIMRKFRRKTNTHDGNMSILQTTVEDPRELVFSFHTHVVLILLSGY